MNDQITTKDMNTACLYTASILVNEKTLKDDDRVGLRVKHLKTTRLPGGFLPQCWEVPELEDDEFASKVEMLYGDLPAIARYWRKMTNLKWAHTPWNGVDCFMESLDKSEPLPKFKLTKMPGSINAPLISEYVIGYIIAIERSFFEAKESQKKAEWKQMIYAKARKMHSVTVGILGFGDIGKYLAKTCKTFGMTVWSLTKTQLTKCDTTTDVDFFRTTEGLSELLRNCDYICNTLPSTDKTKHLLSGNVLSNCKDSVFINVGRGDVIDEYSLVKALRSGWLRGAVLDVFEEEPVPDTSPLWSMSNVIITPHVSGWSFDMHREAVECFLDNYDRYMSGKPLIGELDWKRGY